jgi:predicted anti-sigma-YlaC factor YlaD
MTACERAQQWISLELDGELSEFEQAALARHLGGCVACRAVSLRVSGFTSMLRAELLVEPERPVVVTASHASRARLARRGGLVLAFAAAVGSVAGALVLSQGGGRATSTLSFRSVTEQRRFAHVEHIRAEPETFALAAVLPTVPSFAARALG